MPDHPLSDTEIDILHSSANHISSLHHHHHHYYGHGTQSPLSDGETEYEYRKFNSNDTDWKWAWGVLPSRRDEDLDDTLTSKEETATANSDKSIIDKQAKNVSEPVKVESDDNRNQSGGIVSLETIATHVDKNTDIAVTFDKDKIEIEQQTKDFVATESKEQKGEKSTTEEQPIDTVPVQKDLSVDEKASSDTLTTTASVPPVKDTTAISPTKATDTKSDNSKPSSNNTSTDSVQPGDSKSEEKIDGVPLKADTTKLSVVDRISPARFKAIADLPTLELSLCGTPLFADVSLLSFLTLLTYAQMAEVTFTQYRITYQEFCRTPDLLRDNKLVCRIGKE